MPISPATSALLNKPLRSEAEAREDIARARLAEMKARWQREGWTDCDECEGTGRVLHCHRLDQEDIELVCIECNGNGQKRVDFWDWMEGQEQ